VEKRDRVLEYRITSHLHLTGYFIVRWWIESEPEFGGVDRDTAYRQTEDAIRAVYENAQSQDRSFKDIEISHFLLERVPAANSVETCNEFGNGVTVHRDWP
jgi:hypothetical protein